MTIPSILEGGGLRFERARLKRNTDLTEDKWLDTGMLKIYIKYRFRFKTKIVQDKYLFEDKHLFEDKYLFKTYTGPRQIPVPRQIPDKYLLKTNTCSRQIPVQDKNLFKTNTC